MSTSEPAPLSIIIEQMVGVDPMGPSFSDAFGELYWLASAFGYYKGEFAPPSAIAQTPKLDPIQEKSFQILWNWWISHAAIYRLDPGKTEATDVIQLVEGLPHVLHAKYVYSKRMIELMRLELYRPAFTGTPENYMHLERIRRSAFIISACQMMAIDCYQTTSGIILGEGAKSYKGVILDQGGSDIPILPPQMSTTSQKPPEAEDPIILRPDRQRLNCPGIDPCPWLVANTELPFFLWDRNISRTVEVSSLAEKPSYTTISHTWGRWQITHEGMAKKTAVVGVSGWKIPENSIFDVTTLPSILSRMPTSSRFIWLDLLCIPQDGSQKADDEIARQAAIFRNAEYCMVWLNTVDSWDGLRSAITWMSLIFLGCEEKESTVASNAVYGNNQLKGNCTGLFYPYQLGPGILRKSLKPCGWFTSLWTLQELCMRPDMLLCNGNMELLSVGYRDMPVTIDALIALTGECTRILESHVPYITEGVPFPIVGDMSLINKKILFDVTMSGASAENLFEGLLSHGAYHPGYVELFELFDRCGISALLSLLPKHILNLASLRFCKESRAEAIMSVFGATSWYEKGRSGGKTYKDSELILGQYPPAFIKEVHTMLGATFFDFLSVSSSDIPHIATAPLSSYRGSLMPFNYNKLSSDHTIVDQKYPLYPLFDMLGEESHPSVKTWQILVDGSVRIQNVGLIASSRDKETTMKQMTVPGSVWLSHETTTGFGEDPGVNSASFEIARWKSVYLRQFLQRYHIDEGTNYAVELRSGPISQRGILLKEYKQHPGVLFKIGNFYITNAFQRAPIVQAETIPVNWIVV